MSGVPDPAAIAQERGYLFRYALGRLRDRDLAEDVVQETLTAALQGLARYQARSALRTWLTAILRHKIADQLRSRGVEVAVEGIEDEAAADDDFEDMFDAHGRWQHGAMPRAWNDPLRAIEREQFRAVFDRCMKRLPARIAEAFYLREVLGEPIEIVCKDLEISATNCSVMLFRARMRLRACLEVKWFAGAARE